MNDAIKPAYRPEAEQVLIDTGDAHFKRQDILNAGANRKKANPDSRLISERYSWED